jgi:hypothetical protein
MTYYKTYTEVFHEYKHIINNKFVAGNPWCHGYLYGLIQVHNPLEQQKVVFL